MPTKKKPVDDAPKDEPVAFDLDLDSFNRAERRQLQDKYGRPFAGLIEFVSDGIFRHPIRVEQADGSFMPERMPMPEPIVVKGNVGQPENVWPDDVLIEMVLIQGRRDGGQVDEDLLAGMGQDELRAAVDRGRAGKARTPKK